MKTIIISILTILTGIPLFAQNNIGNVLDTVEKNNNTLKALRETVEAQKLGNRTGIFLSNPEVAFNYMLPGKSGNVEKRGDISLRQNFDIPTLLGMKSRVADGQNVLLEWQYKTNRMNILLEAKQYCIELTYNNALLRELKQRLQHAQIIAAGYETRLKAGDANRLEYNKVQLNLATVQGEISRIEVERNALLTQLKRLNGGTDIAFSDDAYADVSLPLNFDEWFAQAAEKNPVLLYAKQETELSKRQLTLSRATGLPTFSAGYMREKVGGLWSQGLSLGISIPLWENKNRVKQAKASARAALSRETDSRLQLYNQLQTLYNRTAGLKTTAENYRKTLITVNNIDLLKKALDTGEISLLNYILEMALYYTTVNQALEAERDYQKAFAELAAVEL